jgi:hypothetical protein
VLKIDQRQYSPLMMDKIAFAGTTQASWQKAARALGQLAGRKISAMEVARITEQIGEELLHAHERDAEMQRRRQLQSTIEQPVDIACVEVDGGRMRTRDAEQGRGVHGHAWKETKVAALWRMTGPTFPDDPHPEPPRCFLDQPHVPQLVREIKRQRGEQHARDENPGKTGPKSLPEPLPELATEPAAREWPPRRIFRTCVATFKDVYEFGPLVAAEAQRRGFYDAARRAFLGDGDHKNWTVHKLHFPRFTAITDFVHPVTYLYDAAGAVTNSWAAQWEQYSDWMTACWQGRVAWVIAEISAWQARLGLPKKDTPDNDPRKILAKAVTYLQNNEQRMNYPEYRRQGLPITSCLVESLIKEINARVKGTDRFWNRPSALEGESILQATASELSDGEPLTKHILSRPGSHFYRRSTAEHLGETAPASSERT